MFGGDCFDQFVSDFNDHQLQFDRNRNDCKIVFGGDCFDQFASDFDNHSSDFDDHSPKSVTI